MKEELATNPNDQKYAQNFRHYRLVMGLLDIKEIFLKGATNHEILRLLVGIHEYKYQSYSN
jgi:hypothetical protein